MSYLLIGLGNPGKKFESTRHNAGKAFIRWMNEGQGLRDKGQGEFKAVETECFMNESGSWLKSQLNRLKKTASLFICHDDLDIPLGKFKIQFGKGPRLHKGILSVEQALGTKGFWRVRIGIEGRRTKDEGRRTSGEDYVLERFSADERKTLESVFPEIRKKLLENVIL